MSTGRRQRRRRVHAASGRFWAQVEATLREAEALPSRVASGSLLLCADSQGPRYSLLYLSLSLSLSAF